MSRNPRRITPVAAAALAVLVAAGCGDPPLPAPASPTATSGPVGPAFPTITDYLRRHGITATAVQPGVPGAPRIDVPVPPGWQTRPVRGAWLAMFGADPATAADPPAIVAVVSRLSGTVDPAELLSYAPGELHDLPDFRATGDDAHAVLAGFPAQRIGGTYRVAGAERVIAQKTAVLPLPGATFVLQINANAPAAELAALGAATELVDARISIAP